MDAIIGQAVIDVGALIGLIVAILLGVRFILLPIMEFIADL